jgi:hypothetical protein
MSVLSPLSVFTEAQPKETLPSFFLLEKETVFSTEISGRCPFYLQLFWFFPFYVLQSKLLHYSPECHWNENKEFSFSLLRGTQKLRWWEVATAHPQC